MTDKVDPRVLFAAERTLLAWNRTSLALIAFGFLIERSGLLLIALLPDRAELQSVKYTFLCGVGLILLGVACAVYSSKQYLCYLKTLPETELPRGYNVKWGVLVNVTVSLLALILVLALYASH